MRLILSIVCICLCVVCHAQKKQPPAISIIKVANTVQYQISNQWNETSDFKDKRTGTEFINFQRGPMQIDSVKSCIVTQSCKVENARGANIRTYSLARIGMFQKQKDFRVMKIITNTDGLLQVPYSVGFWALYTDENDIVHKVIIIHGIHPNGFGFQFFIDCPKDIFPALEQEITDQVRSISFL